MIRYALGKGLPDYSQENELMRGKTGLQARGRGSYRSRGETVGVGHETWFLGCTQSQSPEGDAGRGRSWFSVSTDPGGVYRTGPCWRWERGMEESGLAEARARLPESSR